MRSTIYSFAAQRVIAGCARAVHGAILFESDPPADEPHESGPDATTDDGLAWRCNACNRNSSSEAEEQGPKQTPTKPTPPTRPHGAGKTLDEFRESRAHATSWELTVVLHCMEGHIA